MSGVEVTVDGRGDMGTDGGRGCMCGGEVAVDGRGDMGKVGANGCMCGVEVAVGGRERLHVRLVTYQRDFTVIPIPPIPPILYGVINQTDTQLCVGKNISPISHPRFSTGPVLSGFI